jgi:folate-dependent phosphoribosylglycinamide formyltransferase PurN
MNRGKLRIVVLFSGGASAAQYLIENDTNYGKTYQFVFALTDKKGASGVSYFEEKEIPCMEVGIKQYNVKHHYFEKVKDMPDNIRRAYFTHLRNIIEQFKPDLILLSGFMLKIVSPLLGHCPIINVHPADLRIKNPDGTPKYTGDDAVTLAIHAGETSTASTIHVVEEKVDEGKIICVSQPLTVQPEVPVIEHQNRMKIFCDGPAYIRALEMICSEEFTFTA